MKIKSSIVLVTGATGGIGDALVDELLRRGASKIYAGGRNETALSAIAARAPEIIVPLVLDVTDEVQVAAAARKALDVNLLINNAGYCGLTGALSKDAVVEARREMDVNYFGVLRMAHAFAPALAANGGGAIVNIVSFLALATLPLMGTYCASKSAELALSRSLRAELAAGKTAVLASLPVQVDTPMAAWTDQPKVSPRDVAAETLAALEAEAIEVFPGRLSREAAASFAADPKSVEAFLASILPVAT